MLKFLDDTLAVGSSVKGIFVWSGFCYWFFAMGKTFLERKLLGPSLRPFIVQ